MALVRVADHLYGHPLHAFPRHCVCASAVAYAAPVRLHWMLPVLREPGAQLQPQVVSVPTEQAVDERYRWLEDTTKVLGEPLHYAVAGPYPHAQEPVDTSLRCLVPAHRLVASSTKGCTMSP